MPSTASPKVVRAADQSVGRKQRSDTGLPLMILGAVGAALLCVGGADVALTWYPLNFGSVEWEFATITATMNAHPTVVLGLAALLAWAGWTGRRRLTQLFGGTAILWAVVLLGIAVLWALTLPLALDATDNPIVRTGLRKAVARTAVQFLVYVPLLMLIGIRSLAYARKIGSAGREL